MTIKSGFEFISFGDEVMLIPVGDEAHRFRGLVVMNDETALIIRLLQKEQTMEELLDAFLAEYDMDRDAASLELERLLNRLDDLGILEHASVL